MLSNIFILFDFIIEFIHFYREVCETVKKRECKTVYRDGCYWDFSDALSEEYFVYECTDKVEPWCTKKWINISPNQIVWDIDVCKNRTKTECENKLRFRWVKKPKKKCAKTAIGKEYCKNKTYTDCKAVSYGRGYSAIRGHP